MYPHCGDLNPANQQKKSRCRQATGARRSNSSQNPGSGFTLLARRLGLEHTSMQSCTSVTLSPSSKNSPPASTTARSSTPSRSISRRRASFTKTIWSSNSGCRSSWTGIFLIGTCQASTSPPSSTGSAGTRTGFPTRNSISSGIFAKQPTRFSVSSAGPGTKKAWLSPIYFPTKTTRSKTRK